MQKRVQTKYFTGLCKFAFSHYVADNSIAVTLVDNDTGEMITKATVCLSDYGKKPAIGSHIFVKDYAENEGLYQGLLDAGVVGEFVFKHSEGPYKATIYECPLTQESLDECTRQFHERGVPLDTRMDG
jgi:hypothetical protein